MADNTIGWGQGSVNNTNDWGKGKANSTNDWGSIYANSPSGDTNIEGGSAGTDFTTNLVASYNFDTNFADYTGNNDLTASGTTSAGVTGGKVSDCSDFPGGVNYASSLGSNDFTFTDGVTDLPFSISFWVNFDSILDRSSIIMNRFTSSSNGGWQIDWNTTNQIRFILGDYLGITNRITATFPLTPITGNWYHVAVSYDGSSSITGIQLYLNGLSQTITDESAGSYTKQPNIVTNIVLGTESFDIGDSSLDGKLDEFHIWKNRELSASEVLEIYNIENSGTSILP